MHFEWNIEIQLGYWNLIDIVVRVLKLITSVSSAASWR